VADQHPLASAATPHPHGFGAGDVAFLCVLALALVAVVLTGRFAYHEGALLETAKSNAQAFVKWAEAVAATADKDAPLTLASCGPMPGEAADEPEAPAVATNWVTCREALFTAGGPLSHLSNPFDANNPVAGSRCEKKSAATRGLVFLEKGTPSPPGMPPNVSWTPLQDDEPVARGLMLRVQACDAGGYPIRIAEVKL
jgi:hypothetical protein